MVSTASTNALPMNCPWRNKLSPSPRPRRGVHIVKVCPVDNIYLLCYTATCLSSIAGAGYSSPFPSHQGVHTRWFGRALEWHSRGQRFDPAYLHQTKTTRTFVRVVFVWLQERRSHGAGLLRSAERSVGQTVRPRLSPSNEKHWKHYVFDAFSFCVKFAMWKKRGRA